MLKQTRIFLVLLIIFSASCSNDQENNASISKSKSEMETEIEGLTDSLSLPMDAARSKQLSMRIMRATTRFVDEYSNDPKAPEYLFISARAANGLRKYEKSLKIMNTIKQRYQDYNKLPEVYFLYAFTLDEDLKRKEEAKDAYMELINKFPDDHLSKQAVLLMDQLYLSDEELIQKWKEQEEAQQ